MYTLCTADEGVTVPLHAKRAWTLLARPARHLSVYMSGMVCLCAIEGAEDNQGYGRLSQHMAASCSRCSGVRDTRQQRK